MVIQFRKLYDDVELPQYSTKGAAGFDLKIYHFKRYFGNNVNFGTLNSPSDITSLDTNVVIMKPFSRLLAGCGFSVKIPEGTQLEVRSRSGLSLKEGIICLNAPGTIDEDYTGEVGVILYNSTPYEVEIKIGDRVAQAVLMPYIKAEFNIVEELEETTRGSNGYGSTGK